MAETANIFEVMSTMRAMRRLKPDPVPDDLINKILQAAQWAPSGGNTQRWRFWRDAICRALTAWLSRPLILQFRSGAVQLFLGFADRSCPDRLADIG